MCGRERPRYPRRSGLPPHRRLRRDQERSRGRWRIRRLLLPATRGPVGGVGEGCTRFNGEPAVAARRPSRRESPVAYSPEKPLLVVPDQRLDGWAMGDVLRKADAGAVEGVVIAP